MQLHGTLTALVTPFKNGELDIPAFQNLIEAQIEAGINGLVPCGSTGEFAALSEEEHYHLVKTCVATAQGRVPVIAGASDINPHKVIHLGQQALDAGADAIMVVTPYFVKPTQDQVHDFYALIDDALSAPILLYNNPGRSATNMSIETIARLSKRKNIVGIKEADADPTRPTKIRASVEDDTFAILSGNASSVLAFMAQGGDGVISTTSNVLPRECVKLLTAWQNQDHQTIQKLRYPLLVMDEALYIEPAPATIKYVLSKLGLCTEEVRAPLTPLIQSSKTTIDHLMKDWGV